MSRLAQKFQAARSADANYQREEARETLALWQAQDTSECDYRERASFEIELAKAASARPQNLKEREKFELR